MKKKILLVFLLILIFSLCKIDVNASSYAYCYYNYTTSDKDFCYRTKRGFAGVLVCDKQGGLALVIQYNSENNEPPKLIGKVYNKEEYNLKDTDNFVNSYNEIKVERGRDINCINYSNFNKMCMSELPSVNVAQLKNNEGKLTCPNIYLYKKNRNIDLGTDPYWKISLSSNETYNNGENYDKTDIISPISKFTKTNTDDTENPNVEPDKEVVATCQYKYENYRYTPALFASGKFGFSILKDGTIDGIVATGELSSTSFKFKGDKIADLKCPNYLKFSTPVLGDNTFSIVDSKEKADAIYEGNIANTDDNMITKYRHLNNSSKYIEIRKSGDTYIASINSKNITIENMNEFFNSQMSTKPTYIVEVSSGGSLKYKFTNKVVKGESQNIYMESQKMLDLSDLSTSDVIYSCEELFGGTFIGFLKRNVYIPFVIAIPILLIVLTTIDFAKVVFSEDKEGVKKAGTKFGKRAIMAIIILLVPTILIFIADTIGVDEVQECAKLIKSYSGENSDTNSEKNS